MVTGRVRTWNAEDGWGVLDSEETPGGCWFHVSVLGGPEPTAGQTVELTYERVEQDGYPYRATFVAVGGSADPNAVVLDRPSPAYRSGLAIEWDEVPAEDGGPAG